MALRNQPYLPLYVNDFMNDEKLKPCSAESTGVYIRVMCLLHKCEEYGALTFNELDARTDDICYDFARVLLPHLPYTLDVIHRGLKELTARKVLTIDGERLAQKRMVKDGNLSAARSSAGSAGGNAKASSTSKTPSKHTSKSVANSETETDTVNGISNVPSSGGFLSDSEMLFLSRDLNATYDLLLSIGFHDTQADRDRCERMVADYTADWVQEAIRRTGDAPTTARCWRYIDKILRNWRAAGGMDSRERTSLDDDQRLPPMITEV